MAPGGDAIEIIGAERATGLAAVDRRQVIDRFERRGLVSLRGFAVDEEAVCAFTGGLTQGFGRIGGALRVSRNEDGTLFDVTDGDRDLVLHTELGHSPNRPDIVWFWCVVPAQRGGETLLVDGEEVARQLSAETRALFARQRLRYRHRMPRVMWQSFFGVDEATELRTLLTGYEGVRALSIGDRGTAELEYIVPALRPTRFGGALAFSNSIQILTSKWVNEEEEGGRPVRFDASADDGFSMAVGLEDGAAIPEWALADIAAVANRLAFAHRLDAGELLMIDNTRYQHGRRAFVGPRAIRSRFGMARFT